MGVVNNKDPMERIIHQEFHDLADRHDIDVDIVAEIIVDWLEWGSENIIYTPIPSEN